MSRLFLWIRAARPGFLTASIAPVIVGSALGFAACGNFSTGLFVLALAAIIFLHSGANLANDYFDHLSGNDQANLNPTPFSGGSRYIQDGLLKPKFFLISSLFCLAISSVIGIVILLLTKSLFILLLGLVGLLGGFFYTAPPIKLGYRTIGEPLIGLLFGLLPVYGAYYLQTRQIDLLALWPGIIVGILIFLVILINDFPDDQADASVGKKTLVVRFGVAVCVIIYRVTLIVSFIIAASMMFIPILFFAGLFYFLTAPIAFFAFRSANEKELTKLGVFRANQITIMLHLAGSAAVTIGFVIYHLMYAID